MKTKEPDFTDPRMLREQAEKILQQKRVQAKLDEKSEVDAKKLLHELQVHQIELEMQNDELQKAYETAESALKKYTLVFDQAPMGFVTLESDGTITELNFSAAEMLCDRRFSLIGSKFKMHISEESKIFFNSFFKNLYASHKKESCTVMFDCDTNTTYQIYIEGIVIENDSKCLLSMVNVSHLK